MYVCWVSIFFELFSPGSKFRDEELKRLENTRVVDGVSEPGTGPIDLTSGKVILRGTAEQAAQTKLAVEAAQAEAERAKAERRKARKAAAAGDQPKRERRRREK